MASELSSIVDVLPGLVWTALPDGRVDCVNQAWCEYTGHDPGQARALGWASIIHPDDLPGLLDGWQSALSSGEPGEKKARLRRLDGVYRRFVLRMRPLVDASSEITRWCGVGTDIEDCAHAEETADVRDIDLRATVDSIPAFIGLAAPSGAIEYFNRFAREYLGMALDELTGWKSTVMVHPDDLSSVTDCWKQAVATGEPYDFTHRVRRADGAYRWFQVRGLPLRDSEGHIDRWFVVNADVDEQKRGEALLSSEKQLLELVARGRSQPEILDALCRLVEGTITGCYCSVMLLDPSGTHMEHGAGPSLPASFIRRIEGASVGVDLGPCPMAVSLNEQIIAPDLATETRWESTRWPVLAMSHGLRSCWSTPITAISGEMLGVFAIYHDQPRSPTPRDLALIDQLTHIADIAVERLRSRTSLAQALDDIRASEDRLRNIVDAGPGFVWSTAPDGSVDFINQRWCDYTGMTLGDSHGFGWLSAVHPDDAGGLATYWQTLLEAGQPGEYEARLRRFDGIYRWFLIRAVPQRDETGQLVKWYGANTDIEDRKQAETLLSGEKQLLGMMAGSSPLAPILEEVCRLAETILDGSLCSIVLVDPRRTRLPQDDIFRLRLLPGASPHLPASLAESAAADADVAPFALAAILNEQVISIDLAQETRWREWCSTALSHGIQANWSTPIASTNGKVAGVLSVLYRQPKAPEPMHQGLIARFAHLANIAIERAHSEAALKQSEAFVAKAQRLSQTGTFSWRVGNDEIVWSEEIYRILELDPAVAPNFELIYTRIHPEDAPAHQEMMRRQRDAASDFEDEHRLLMPDGRVKWVHLVAHATRDKDGGLEYIAALQDVTQRRFSEEALGKVRSELAHVARVASLGTLTASIAHEVNQPLAGIITNASTCLRMLAATPPNVEGARETARRTIRDGNRASDVIKRLRSLFAKKKAATETLDLNEAAREVIAMLLGELQRSGVTLHPEFADDLPPVVGDRVQLQQVILNLVLNAADAMGGIVDRPRRMVIRTARDENGHVRLDVRDTGAGFDPQDADALFNAFYTTKSDGMGIGLSVSRSIIEGHDGRLWAAANDGHGATFSFSIPCQPEKTVAIPSTGAFGEDAHADVDRTISDRTMESF